MRLLALLSSLGILILPLTASAAGPREELKALTAQLQKEPSDDALRAKAIALAVTLKPAPAIPEEAREPFVMGATVLKKASNPAGAGKAIGLFTQAIAAAPWYADAYYNRALAREIAGQFEAAIDDLKLYLKFKLSEDDRRAAQDKIYTLKAETEISASKKSDAINDLEGSIFASVDKKGTEIQYRITNGRADIWTRRTEYRGSLCYDGLRRDGPIGEEVMCPDGTGAGRLTIPLNGRHGEFEDHPGYKTTIDISEDGQSLLMKQSKGWDGNPKEYPFTRR